MVVFGCFQYAQYIHRETFAQLLKLFNPWTTQAQQIFESLNKHEFNERNKDMEEIKRTWTSNPKETWKISSAFDICVAKRIIGGCMANGSNRQVVLCGWQEPFLEPFVQWQKGTCHRCKVCRVKLIYPVNEFATSHLKHGAWIWKDRFFTCLSTCGEIHSVSSLSSTGGGSQQFLIVLRTFVTQWISICTSHLLRTTFCFMTV